MKASTPELNALLASKQAIIADLFTLTLSNGDIFRLNSAPDFDVLWQGLAYTRQFVIARGDLNSSVGVEVDEVDITLYIRPADLIYGLPLPQFVHNRGFDGARVLIQRAFMAQPGVPVGVVHSFEGEITAPEPSRTVIMMKASSELIKLNQLVPRNTITPKCGNQLFDGLCGVVRDDYSHTGTTQAGTTKIGMVTGLVQADGYFTHGTITVTSGANAGAKRTVKRHASGLIVPAYPFYYPFAVGDDFIAVAGCNRLRQTCVGKFNKESNFRAFENVPTPVASA